MDQDTGRRRSSRLAARGVTTPRAEVVKKTLKSSEKPKRTKRKTTEEVVELPEAKKNKTSVEVDDTEVNNTNDAEKSEISGVESMDVDHAETSVLPTSNVEPIIEDKTDLPTQDSKEQKVIDENIPIAKEDQEKVDTFSIDDKKQPEPTEDTIKIKDPETTEPPKNDVSKEETKQEPVVLENTNGTSDEKESVEPAEIINKSDIIIATKDIVTPNGDTNDKVKSNGDASVPKSPAIEPLKVLREDKNNAIQAETKAITTPTIVITTTNNDASSVEQVDKELDKTIENVDNKSLSADDNAPKVDQSSTVIS